MSNKLSFLITAFAMIAVLATASYAASTTKAEPTADINLSTVKVNGIVIPAKKQKAIVDSLKKANPKLTDAQAEQFVRSLLMEEAVYTSNIEKQNMDLQADYAIELSRLVSQFNARKLSEKYLSDPKNQATDQEIANAYNRLKAAYGDTEYTTRHIRVKTQEEALKALKRVQGHESFEKVAREISIDPTKAQGGLIENVSLSVFEPALASVIKSLPKNEIANHPIEIRSGWVIVQKISSRPQQRFAGVAKMKEELRALVNADKAKIYLRKLLSSAKVEELKAK